MGTFGPNRLQSYKQYSEYQQFLCSFFVIFSLPAFLLFCMVTWVLCVAPFPQGGWWSGAMECEVWAYRVFLPVIACYAWRLVGRVADTLVYPPARIAAV